MKSSLARILWSVAYLSIAVVGLRFATGTPPFRVSASPQRERTLVRKPWLVEPVKVVAAKNKKKANIEIGRAFDDDDDWLDGFTVTVANNSDRTVTAVIVEMIFRREAGDTRPPVAELLNFGPRPTLPEYLLRDPHKIIKVGKTADLQLNSHNYKMLTDRLLRKGYLNGAARVELVISQVGFEDGSVLDSGTLWLQDPNNPNDPAKKIRADKVKPPGVQNHHASTSKGPKTVNPKLAASFTEPGSISFAIERRSKTLTMRSLAAGPGTCSWSRSETQTCEHTYQVTTPPCRYLLFVLLARLTFSQAVC